MVDQELVDQLIANAKVLAKLAKYYDKFTSRPSVHHMTEFKAQRYMEIRREQEALMEKLRKLP